MTHYQALELPTDAPAADVRRAYRRLVLLTHPDRTPDPAAHARYLAINAAYEVLSDPARRQAYDTSFQEQPAFIPSSPGRARDAARQAARRRSPRPRAVPLAEKYAEEYARFFRLARPLLVASLLLCGTLAVDFALASTQVEQVLARETTVHYTRSSSYETTSHRTNRGTLKLRDAYPVGTTAWVRRTPLLRTPLSIAFSATDSPDELASIYEGARNFFWLGLLACAALGLLPGLGTEGRLSICLLGAAFLFTTLVQLLA
ncbi:J domain-containing protein [Hymenobacter ruricola]|uniref:J domain-containing protein n=1 Tax=Hymenobacter ruricola TaxID=2791023 RepID=A0ABS0I4N8_9BACT|nr:J domain-containing protein [Hymenobacter ruricola]MBF9221921.1 J domain-containing protein [Hymenobacter ruricola]